MRLHFYIVNPIMRNFGLHHHGVINPDGLWRMHNLHLWFVGIGFYYRASLKAGEPPQENQ